MVDVSSSSTSTNNNNTLMDVIIPEDNVERLRNIRDMFENTDQQQTDDQQKQLELQKVEKLIPSEKIKNIFLNDFDADNNIVMMNTSSTNDDEDNNFEDSSNNNNNNSHDDDNNTKHSTAVVFDSLEDLNQNNNESTNEYEIRNSSNINNNDNNVVDDDDLSTRSNSPSSVSSLSSQSTPSFTQEQQQEQQQQNDNDDAKNDIARNGSYTFSDEMNDFNNSNRFEDGLVDENGEAKEPKKEPVVVFTELNTVKTKFEHLNDTSETTEATPKPVRSITPPREGVNKGEIENEPMQRPADVVSATERIQETLPESGTARSRKEMFQQVASSSPAVNGEKRIKSITPPRDEKRILKEKTPERNENVIREADRHEEVLPSAGTAKQTAAIFAGNNASLAKSIERSGITIEGELTEKGIAKSRLALFSNISNSPTTTTSAAPVETENISGIAKERLSLFKNLEQTRQSPPKEVKKLKEFTPPPQLDTQQRQYIIIDKETPNVNTNGDVVKEAQKVDEFVPEAGLAKNRMKQYLETANQSPQQNGTANGEEQLPEKGIAKSLLAKWKSIENLKEKETSPELSTTTTNGLGTPTVEGEPLPSGIAKNLLNKWQNIDKENGHERKSVSPPNGNAEDEATIIEKGYTKNALAKFQQTIAESSTNIKKSVTPPREIIAASQNARSIYESTPAESNINTQYCEEEIIPSAGTAKSLKSKFQTMEKEAAKVETSSSKLHYVPKKFITDRTTAAAATTTTTTTKSNTTNGKSTTNTNGGAHTSLHANNTTPHGDKCCVCEKTVYAMEKIEADKKVYHKLCFKCTACNCTLKLGNFSSINNKLYCTPHYIQLFARNGNYDEGFGLENYKRKWLNRPSNGNEPTTTVS